VPVDDRGEGLRHSRYRSSDPQVAVLESGGLIFHDLADLIPGDSADHLRDQGADFFDGRGEALNLVVDDIL
jgi:hypothetical protein